MLIWVASYPRSGNTLTLRTLGDVFGINRFCTIHEPDLWMRKRSRTYEIPKELEGLGQSELMDALRGRPEPFFIKSHRRSDCSDPAPALYVVRDGRDVHVSYTHWTEDRSFNVRGKPITPETPFEDRLDALVSRRSWSRHVNSWRKRKAPTAIVHYEELLQDPGGVLKGACEELDVPLPVSNGEPVPFDELHERNPTMYRKGKAGSWQEEMSPKTQRRFWRVHGAEMEALGYAREMTPA